MTWATKTSMSIARMEHSLIALQDDRILAVGGRDAGLVRIDECEIYNPFTDTWSAAGTLNFARERTSVTLLPDGRVFCVGGFGTGFRTPEIYDPNTDSWTLKAVLTATGAVIQGQATILIEGGPNDGNVLLVHDNQSFVYNVAGDSWSAGTALPSGSEAANRFTLTRLQSGNILCVGGNLNLFPGGFLSKVSEYDITTGTWSVKAELNAPRAVHQAALLGNGDVLVCGGYETSGGSILDTAEVYDGSSWTVVGSMSVPRYHHVAVSQPGGTVFVTCGRFSGSFTTGVTEIYTSGAGWAVDDPKTFGVAQSLGNSATTAKYWAQLSNGSIFIAGGANSSNQPTTDAELFGPVPNPEVTLTSSMDMVISSSIIIPSGLSLVKVRGDIKTRYWAGHDSDANFPEELSNDPPDLTITETNGGSITRNFQSLDFTLNNNTQTGGNFDAASFGIDTASFGVDIPTGSRLLCLLTITDFQENTDFAVGFTSAHGHDAWTTNNRLAFQFINEEGHLRFNLLWGDQEKTFINPLWSPSYLENKRLLVELERTAALEATARLYFEDENVTDPVVTISASTGFTPVVGSVVHLGTKITPRPYTPAAADVSGSIEFIDVEVGTGSSFADPISSIDAADSKFRKRRDTVLFTLSDPDGVKQTCLTLADEDFNEADEACSSILLDRVAPSLNIVRIAPEVLRIRDNALKVSLQPGFDEIEFGFSSDRTGVYSLRSNSTSAFNGTEVLRGDYVVSGSIQRFTVNTSSLPDDVHDIFSDLTLYMISKAGIASSKLPSPTPNFVPPGSGFPGTSYPTGPVLNAVMDMLIIPSVGSSLTAAVAEQQTLLSSMDMSIQVGGVTVPLLTPDIDVYIVFDIRANMDMRVSASVDSEMSLGVATVKAVVAICSVNVTDTAPPSSPIASPSFVDFEGTTYGES